MLPGVLKCLTNVETLSVNVYVEPKGRTVGIVKGLELLKPKSLYLHNCGSKNRYRFPTSKNTEAVRHAVFESMKGWKELVSAIAVLCIIITLLNIRRSVST